MKRRVSSFFAGFAAAVLLLALFTGLLDLPLGGITGAILLGLDKLTFFLGTIWAP